MSRSAFIEAEQHEKRRIAAKRPRPGSMPDPEDLYVIRKCSGECLNLWTFKKGGLLASRCPSCSGEWLRGDPDLVGWAC